MMKASTEVAIECLKAIVDVDDVMDLLVDAFCDGLAHQGNTSRVAEVTVSSRHVQGAATRKNLKF